MIKEDEYKKVVARNLRNIMWQHQKTQAEVARDLKINKATLSAWMNGTRTPKMKNIDMLCEYFGVQRSALMGFEPRENLINRGLRAPLVAFWLHDAKRAPEGSLPPGLY